MSAKRIDLQGQVFGKLTVISEVLPHIKGTHWRWLCQCACGNTTIVMSGGLRHGGTRSCGCSQFRKRPFEWLYNRLLRTGESTKHEVRLSYEDFLEYTCIKTCHYCGADITWHEYSSGLGVTRNSGYYLDRKESNLGYTKDNCVVCCPRCNWAKSDRFTYEEWAELGKVMKTWVKELPKNSDIMTAINN